MAERAAALRNAFGQSKGVIGSRRVAEIEVGGRWNCTLC
jgi:hypothetical protein